MVALFLLLPEHDSRKVIMCIVLRIGKHENPKLIHFFPLLFAS